MNLFARGSGGFMSDKGMGYMGMRGRLLAQTICLVIAGLLVIIFAEMDGLVEAIAVMVLFSLFIKAAQGTTYGIVPYVDPAATGSVSGIVGAGGNAGAVGFGFCFRNLEYKTTFLLMGIINIGSSLLNLIIFINGENSLIYDQVDIKDEPSETVALADPVKNIVNSDELSSDEESVEE
jgi:NNP family nitrate/nitrite transporter-like MFS transporter